MKKNNDNELKSILGRWHRRRANLTPPGPAGSGVTAPMPPGEPTNPFADPSSSDGRKDDNGRPNPRVHTKAPTGGPVRPIEASMKKRWRDRRASTLLPGEDVPTSAPMPPGETPPINESTPPSHSPRDDGNRPLPRTQEKKTPTGGPFEAL